MLPTLSVNNRFRLFFGLQYAGIGTFFPYLALYLRNLGLTGAEIGLLLALGPFIAFLVQPLWGMASDVYHRHRLALMFACLGISVTIFAYSQVTAFWLLLLLTILHAIMMAPTTILSTSLALEHLQRQEDGTSFGSLRLFGSIGFTFMTFGIGTWLVDKGNIWWILPIYALINLGLGLTAWSFPDADIHGKVRWRQGLAILRGRADLFWLLAGLVLIGMTMGIGNNYFSIYMTDIGAVGWMIGGALALAAIFEVPLMALAPAFVRRWGVRLVLVGCSALLPLRWLLYLLIDRPALVLPFQVLHSIAMMALLVVGILFMDRLLEPKLRASGQALYAAALHGIGPGTGLYLGGLLYDWNGIDSVWLFCLLIGLVGSTVLAYAVYGQARPITPGVSYDR